MPASSTNAGASSKYGRNVPRRQCRRLRLVTHVRRYLMPASLSTLSTSPLAFLSASAAGMRWK